MLPQVGERDLEGLGILSVGWKYSKAQTLIFFVYLMLGKNITFIKQRDYVYQILNKR